MTFRILKEDVGFFVYGKPSGKIKFRGQKMTKEEFKKKWESDDVGGGLTFEDVADCAKKWGLFSSPKTADIYLVRYRVLVSANVLNAEDFNPNKMRRLDED